MELADQRRLSFQEKMDSLESSFQTWERLSEENQPFRKHHRQMRAIFTVLRKMLVEVGKLGQGERLSGIRNAEKGLLAAQRIWEYFRGKLAQRRDPLLGPYLRFADELAWACYSPLQRLIFPAEGDPRMSEPPLVYLNGGMSPFALTRIDRFTAEEVAGEPLDRSWQAVTAALPVPVIGVPWYQADRIFDALVIAHEVGHLVERDFALEQQIADLVTTAVTGPEAGSRLRAWRAWQSEVFADVFGCLCAGPAFVRNLLETIAVDADAVRDEYQADGQWEKYPTLFVRGLLNMAALKHLGFKDDATLLENAWRKIYHEHGMNEFEADVEPVAHAILEGRYPAWNGTLREAIDTASIDLRAHRECSLLSGGASPQSDDFRVLFVASRLAYERDRRPFLPDARVIGGENEASRVWKEGSWPALLEARMNASIDPSVRAGERTISQVEDKARSSHQEALGESLLKVLVPGL
jgi:hypothetical protein